MNQPSQSPLYLANSRFAKSQDTFFYQIQQQVLPAWQPLPTINSSIILYLILFIFFAVLGGFMLFQDHQADIKSFRYDHVCQSLSTCEITLTIDSKMERPVYLYYKLTNFKQNDRSYMKSKSSDQLEGKWIDLNTVRIIIIQARTSCGSKTTNKEMGWTKAVDGTALDPDEVAYPCGMVSYSMFNDSFSIDTLSISQSSISLPSISSRFTNHNLSKQGIDLHNQHFLVWTRPAPQSSFIKLWGVINQDILPGVYTFMVKNSNIVSYLDYNVEFTERWVEFSNSSVFGNKNNVLGIGYVVAGAICFVVLLVFVAGKGREKVENTQIFQ